MSKQPTLLGFSCPPPKQVVELEKINDHPGRSGHTMIGFYAPKLAHKQLKRIALEEEKTIQELLREAMNKIFTERGLPPIA
jgi:hypothetical protein